jgi:hypothetical protein
VEPKLEDEPDVPRDDLIAVLDSAEDAVNEVAAKVLAEVEAERAKEAKQAGRRWWRFGR